MPAVQYRRVAATGARSLVFYGVTDGSEHIMREHLERLARETSMLHLNVCYSAPTEEDRRQRTFHRAVRVSVDLLKRLLPSSDFDFFICGPQPMMSSLVEG